MKRNHGLTLIEVLMTFAILAVLAVAFFSLFKPNIAFFQKSQNRQLANFEARKCLETIRRLLSDGKASTVQVWTEPGAPPNSTIQFLTINNSSYTITWSNSPPNSVHIQQAPPGAVALSLDSVIAQHVTGIMFTLDARDPAIVNMSFQIDYPLSDDPNSTAIYTILQPNQVIRMSATQ